MYAFEVELLHCVAAECESAKTAVTAILPR